MWHKVIFKGNIVKVRYECELQYHMFDESSYNIARKLEKETVVFYESTSNEPTLAVGEKVAILELGRTYTISEKSNVLGGGVIYHVKENIETIEDEESKKSLKLAKQRLEDLTKIEELKQETRNLRRQLVDERYKNSVLEKRKWWQAWK